MTRAGRGRASRGGVGTGGNGIRHGGRRWIVAIAEGLHDGLLVRRGLVLAELGLADHAVDPDLDSDNRLQQSVEVIGRRVGRLPRVRLGRFVGPREIVEQGSDPLGILDGSDATVDVDHLVIPGRYHAA